MLKTTRLFFQVTIALLLSSLSFAQSWDWVISGGGTLSDKATTIVADDEGNTYITGYYNEEANFGPFNTGFSFASSKEVFVAKIDPNGNYVWVKNGLNFFDDRGLGLCLDPNGNVYVTGTCWGGLDFGTLSVYNSTSYTDQIFVIKLDNNGNEIWMKNAGVDESSYPYNDDHGQDLVSDSQGNIYVTGFISNNENVVRNANFDNFSIPVQPNDSLAFLAKLSNSGNWQWVRTFPGIWEHRDNGIGIDDEDNVYVTGGFVGTQTFETSTISSVGGEDIYVTKYDQNGNFQFVVQAGDTLDDRGDGIAYGYDGHMYVTGEFRSKAGFGLDSINNYGGPGDRDIFVAKLSKSGSWVWAKKAGSKKGKDRGIGIDANDQGNIFVTGQFRDTAKFGQHYAYATLEDSVQIFVAMIDTSGTWQWVLTGGGADFDRGADVACDANCNVYVTGYFGDTLKLGNANIPSDGIKDIFVAKVADPCTGSGPPPPGSGGPGGPNGPEIAIFNNVNVFTPDGDGVNDVLSFGEFSNIDGEVLIMNRWGNVVFRSNNLATTWDGTTVNGVPVSEGTYFYKLTIKYSEAPTDVIHGFVTVVR